MTTAMSNILTEAGTNELEVLIFRLDNGRYGVNVAKVREILATVSMTQIPQSHPAIRGVFQLRDHVIPLVDLRSFFNMTSLEASESSTIIVTEFNDSRLAFLVDHVERIHRISWEQVNEAPYTSGNGDQAITGVVKLEEDLVLLLDFERIAFRLEGIEVFEVSDDLIGKVDRSTYSVLLADDSETMRRMLEQSITKAGVGKITLANDGEDAWEQLNAMLEADTLPSVIVTDIEMPRMDGLFLTRRIKEHPKLRSIPVIVFSSLVSDDNLKKCQSVGADRQLTKPQLPRLVEIIDELLAAKAK